MAYSEFLTTQKDCTPQVQREQLELIQKKAEQIRQLTDILLDGGRRTLERFEDAHLLVQQLAAEFEEALEDEYSVSTDLTECTSFSGTFDVQELRRIFDNLASNVKKYADPSKAVTLFICAKELSLIIRQQNYIRVENKPSESYQMGLNSIRRIAHNYGGRADVRQADDIFEITVTLSDI